MMRYTYVLVLYIHNEPIYTEYYCRHDNGVSVNLDYRLPCEYGQ